MLSLVVFPVAAQIAPIKGDDCADLGLEACGDSPEDFANVITEIINAFLLIVALIALIAIIVGGVQYITSRGNDQNTEKAKKTIMFSVLGLLVIGLAAALVNFVIDIFAEL